MKKTSKPLRAWTPVGITKHADAKGNRLGIPAGLLAGIDDGKTLLVRLEGKGGAPQIGPVEVIDRVGEEQDKVRVSAALWAALGASDVQYANAEVKRASVFAKLRYDGELRLYLLAAAIALAGAALGVVAALPDPPPWAAPAAALLVVIGLLLGVWNKVRGGGELPA